MIKKIISTIIVYAVLFSCVIFCDLNQASAAWYWPSTSVVSFFQVIINKINSIGNILTPQVEEKPRVISVETKDYFEASGEAQTDFAKKIVSCVKAGKHPVGSIATYNCIESTEVTAKQLAFESFVLNCNNYSTQLLSSIALGLPGNAITWACFYENDALSGIYTYLQMGLGNNSVFSPGLNSGSNTWVLPTTGSTMATNNSAPNGTPASTGKATQGSQLTATPTIMTTAPSSYSNPPSSPSVPVPSQTGSTGGGTPTPSSSGGGSPSGNPDVIVFGSAQPLAWGGSVTVPTCKKGEWC